MTDPKQTENTPDGIPDPADKPSITSGIDANNVRFNGSSLLNPQGDDDWDIPALSFPNIDERGVAAAPDAQGHAAPAETASASQDTDIPAQAGTRTGTHAETAPVIETGIGTPTNGAPTGKTSFASDPSSYADGATGLARLVARDAANADEPVEPAAPAPATPATAAETVAMPPVTSPTAPIAASPAFPALRNAGEESHTVFAGNGTNSPANIPEPTAAPAAPSPDAPAFPPDAGSETTVLPPLDLETSGAPVTTAQPTGIPSISPVVAPGAVDLGRVGRNGRPAATGASPAESAFEHLEEVSDAPTEAEEHDSGDDGSGDGHGDGHDGHGSDGKPNRRPLIIGIVAAVLAVALIGGAFAFVRYRNQTAFDTAFSSCKAAADSATKANDTLTDTLKKADETSSLSNDQVADATTISTLKSVMSDATGMDQVSTCDTGLSTAELNRRADENAKLASTLDGHTTKIEAAVKAVTDSERKQTEAAAETAKENLKSAVTEAQTLMTNSEGAVADDTTRQTLQSAIDAANTLINDDGAKLADLTNALTAIQDATSEVNKSMSSYTYSRRNYYSNTDRTDGNGTNGTNGTGTNGTGTGYQGSNRYNGGTGTSGSGSTGNQTSGNQTSGGQQNPGGGSGPNGANGTQNDPGTQGDQPSAQ
ncbi:hypothetical protein COO72_01565 [Bifidobacterium callitrichos]|nr:hypothetical protein COO72_01565 [Bifidobacterium callitrichos]